MFHWCHLLLLGSTGGDARGAPRLEGLILQGLRALAACSEGHAVCGGRRGLKPREEEVLYRSAEALRHPKTGAAQTTGAAKITGAAQTGAAKTPSYENRFKINGVQNQFNSDHPD
jgi:hypothetical protein